jgi:hypothetical protein
MFDGAKLIGIGDERPCQRCIKRGLQDQCHDGVRKKAKYLSDTPAELLNPPGMGGYMPYINGTKTASSNTEASGVPMTSSNNTGHYPQQPQTPTLDVYGQASNQPQMHPPLSSTGSFGNQQSPISPQFTQHPAQANMATTLGQGAPGMTQFNGLPFDPSDPALFNFDIASLNFGNQYGALEFNMLNHISSGANGETGPDLMNQMSQMPGFNPSFSDPNLTFSQDAFVNADWNSNHPRASSTSGLLQTPHNTPMLTSVDRHDSITHFPKGYAIGAGPPSMASASPAASSGIPDAPLDPPQSDPLFLNTAQNPGSPAVQRQPSKQQPVQPPTPKELYSQAHQSASSSRSHMKRRYDTDFIYDQVNKPYPYTAGFHRLFHYIRQHFSTEKRLKVAKAMAQIRPSLITFSQELTDKDLIFMERSVQRKLYEFSDLMQLTGTPTIMARRDGAIVLASKEFTVLTGWKGTVLLGKEPNLNVNTGGSSGASTAPGSAARTRLPSAEREFGDKTSSAQQSDSAAPAAPPSVLLAEIFDHETVVQFYEDFSRLAFSAAEGSIVRRGKLLTYRTKADTSAQHDGNEDERSIKKRKRSQSIKKEQADMGNAAYMGGEANLTQLGEREGSVDVMMCWSCRRDVFEFPTLIVMNVSGFPFCSDVGSSVLTACQFLPII